MNPHIKKRIISIINENIIERNDEYEDNLTEYSIVQWIKQEWPNVPVNMPTKPKSGLRAAWNALVGLQPRQNPNQQYGFTRIELMRISKDQIKYTIKINDLIFEERNIKSNPTQADKDVQEIFKTCEDNYKSIQDAGFGPHLTPREIMAERYLDKILSNHR